MTKCLECGNSVHPSEVICRNCLDVAAAHIALDRFHREGGKSMADVEKDLGLEEPKADG